MTLTPQVEDELGLFYFDLKFFFIESPELAAYVSISATVEECTFTTIQFAENLVSRVVTIGTNSITLGWPALSTEPECGYQPEYTSSQVSPLNGVEGINTAGLLSSDVSKAEYTLHKTTALGLYKRSILFELQAMTTSSTTPISTKISITYDSSGVLFDPDFNPASIEPLTCSEEDFDWSFVLPDIIASDQQDITITLE